MLDLDFIKAKIAKLTPGPWSFDSSKGDCKSGYEIVSHHGTGIRSGKKVCVILPLDHEEHGDCDENIPSIVQLVVSAPADLTALVAEVERLRKEDEENINRIRELQERNDSLSDENIRLSNQRHIRVAAPPSIIEKLNAKIEQLENEIAVMQQVTLKGLVAEIGQLKVELDKYKTALQKLFSVTPTTNNMPRDLYYLKGFKENHEEALELAKELLWAKNDQI